MTNVMGKPRQGRRLPVAGIIVILAVFITALPAHAQVSVRGDLHRELEVLPGTTHSGTIVLENYDTKPAEVKLYQTDYRTESPGQNFYETPGSHPRSNAGWISISPMRFTIPAGETYSVTYVLEVPADPDLTGSYWSVLMIEAIPPESPESAEADPNQSTVGIITVIRYAFGFVTHIGTTGTAQPEIVNATLTLVDGTPTLGVDVMNAGTRVLLLEIHAELYDAQGALVATREGVGRRSYPGSTRRHDIPLGDIPTGPYTALVIIDAGYNNVFGASLSILLE